MMTHLMRTPALLGLLTLGSLTIACGGDRTPEPETTSADASATRAEGTAVTGCIQGGTDAGTHVLVTHPSAMGAAAERSTRGQVATHTYVLDGGDLDQYVGKEVTVIGTIEARDDLEVEEHDESEAAPTKVKGDTVTPTVEVETAAVIEMRRMQVNSVQATGTVCPAAPEAR